VLSVAAELELAEEAAEGNLILVLDLRVDLDCAVAVVRNVDIDVVDIKSLLCC